MKIVAKQKTAKGTYPKVLWAIYSAIKYALTKMLKVVNTKTAKGNHLPLAGPVTNRPLHRIRLPSFLPPWIWVITTDLFWVLDSSVTTGTILFNLLVSIRAKVWLMRKTSLSAATWLPSPTPFDYMRLVALGSKGSVTVEELSEKWDVLLLSVSLYEC